jgi:hypothetical protein
VDRYAVFSLTLLSEVFAPAIAKSKLVATSSTFRTVNPSGLDSLEIRKE